MDNVTESIAKAPLPTKRTLRQRQGLVFQFWRFVVLNLRMVWMIDKGSH